MKLHFYKTKAVAFGTLVALAAVCGCAVQQEEDVPNTEEGFRSPSHEGIVIHDDTHVVASFRSPDGRRLLFLEPEPGFLSVMQAGKVGAEPLIRPQMMGTLSHVEMYEMVAGEPAPDRACRRGCAQSRTGG